MALILPNRQDASWYDFEIDLDNVTYVFEFYWNTRDAAWVFNLYDVNRNVLIGGRKVVLGSLLLGRFRAQPGIPTGELEAIDTSGKDLDAAIDDLGTRVRLLYTPRAEFPGA